MESLLTDHRSRLDSQPVTRATSILLLFLLVLGGCRSEKEQARDAVLNYVEAIEVHDAPYRAYAFLTSKDKDSVTPEEFSREYATAEADEDVAISILNVSMIPGRANVLVALDRPGEETEERIYMSILDPGDERWRVDMDFERRLKLLDAARRARALAEAGDLGAARALLEDETEKPFRGSRPDLVQNELDAVWAIIEDHERASSVAKRLEAARSLELEPLRESIDGLEPLVKPHETEFLTSLDELEVLYAKKLKAQQLEKFEIGKTRVRRVRRDGDLVREGMVWVSHDLSKPVSTLVLTIEFVNKADGDALGSESYVVMRDKEHVPGETREFVFRIDGEPEGWEGKKIRARAADFGFAGADSE